MSKITASIVIVAGLSCLVLVGSLLNHWLDRGQNAWAYASPALMGTWAGEGLAGQTRMRFALSLSRDEVDWIPMGDSNESGRTISGKVTVRDSTLLGYERSRDSRSQTSA